MSFRILSMYFGHDANVCLLEDGKPVAVIEKERLTRVKHDQGHMLDILPEVMDRYGWTPESVDLLVVNPYCRPNINNQVLDWGLNGEPFTKSPDYLAPDWRGEPEARTSSHTLNLFGQKFECLAVDHHLAHVALALFTSPFEEAGIVSADGGGDERFLALAHGKGNKISWIEYDWGRAKHTDGSELNIGSTWASIGQYNFGYQRLEGAGKLMGLASYQDPEPRFFGPLLHQMKFGAYQPFSAELFGMPKKLLPEEEFAQTLAASLQEVTSQLFLAAAKRMQAVQPVGNLCMVGGCAMNCVANTRVHVSGMFDDTFVPAQPHDGGLALGQALYAWHHVLNNPRKPGRYSPYLGTDAGPAPLDEVERIVELLFEGKTVGLVHGKAESGPRALGHRSILVDPRRAEVREHLNNHVKQREWYRPFAPMVLAEDYGEWFVEEVPSRYMSYTASVQPDKIDELPGITHVDGTARPQLVQAGDDAMTRALLMAWRERTGVPVLLNTSLNCQEPLVDTPAQAEATWRRSGLDVLVTPEGVFEKDQPRAAVA